MPETYLKTLRKGIKMLGKSRPKQPIHYCHYHPSKLKELEDFCAPHEVKKTKKFTKNGRVSLETSNGNLALEDSDVLLKLTGDKFLVLTYDEFLDIF